MTHKKKQIVFLIPYPLGHAPSQRFRFEQYFLFLENNGFRVTVHPFLTTPGWSVIYTKGKIFVKAWLIMKGLAQRMMQMFTIGSADFVFIHRETAPVGPPVFEWIISKIAKKRLIYDFDDAIWLTDKLEESKLEKIIRWRSKVKKICSWSYRVSCGNEYLMNYAQRFNQNVRRNPTTIDTRTGHNPARFTTHKDSSKITIGWTGSHTTGKYLKIIEPVIHQLQQKYQHLNFLIISDQRPQLNVEHIEFMPWKKETEAEDLLKMDIGIMPLPDDEWTKGKCGFKALQYMAMQIPCVLSPVGVNTSIVDHGKTGFIASTEQEWILYLEKLIEDSDLRKKIGIASREKVIVSYSVDSNVSNFLSLLE